MLMKPFAALLLALVLLSPAQAQDNSGAAALPVAEQGDEAQAETPPPGFFAKRPAFSQGDQPPQKVARCEEIRAQAEGVDLPRFRVDLAVAGTLTLVRTDGALWYFVLCSDLRVMCIAYQENAMKVGDRVTVKGGYRRPDDNHVVLDPCLANADPD